MSRESRIIRPYRGVDRFQGILDDLYVEFGDRQIFAGGLATTSSVDFVSQPVRLVLAEDETKRDQVATAINAACQEADLASQNLDLLVVMRTSRLKFSEIVWRVSLDEISNCSLRIDLSAGDRPRSLQTPMGGCVIHTYIALRDAQQRAALSPWRKGTWIARAEHKIKTNVNEVGFTPLELTEKVRADEHLPPGTLRFAIVEEPLAEFSGPESIRLYVDEEVLSELAANPKTDAARAFQRELFMTAMSAAVTESSLQLSASQHMTVDEIEGSVAHRLIELVTGDAPPKQRNDLHQHFFKMLQKDPARFVAHIEDRVPEYRKQMVAALRRSTK